MEKVRYMISDAAAIVYVESHVLRYWEDELELVIPRNEMGHRYYTEENIKQFQRIKELKEQGYQLKAIRILIQQSGEEEKEDKMSIIPVTTSVKKVDQEMNAMDRMEQFQMIMTEIVKKAVEENNHNLGQEVGEQVGERVLKEMNYLMREQDEQEEERFRKLDAAIRGNHKNIIKKEKKLGFRLHTN